MIIFYFLNLREIYKMYKMYKMYEMTKEEIILMYLMVEFNEVLKLKTLI